MVEGQGGNGPCFDAVKPLFDEEPRLLDESPDTETDEWTSAYEAIRAQTRLTYPDGRDVPEYLLHIGGDQAWWLWSDEAFDSASVPWQPSRIDAIVHPRP